MYHKPDEDIEIMAEILEKVFLTQIASLPKDEYEVTASGSRIPIETQPPPMMVDPKRYQPRPPFVLTENKSQWNELKRAALGISYIYFTLPGEELYKEIETTASFIEGNQQVKKHNKNPKKKANKKNYPQNRFYHNYD